MTKSAKTAIICLVVGILLLGLGCVITFFNVSAISYGGEKVYESQSAEITDKRTMGIDSRVDKIHIYKDDIGNESLEVSLQEDENISENELVFEIIRPAESSLWTDFSLIDQYGKNFDSIEQFNQYVRDISNGVYDDDYDEYYDEYYDDDYDDYYDGHHYSAGEYAHHSEHIQQADSHRQMLRNAYGNNGENIRLTAECGFDLDFDNSPRLLRQAIKDLKNDKAYYNYVGSAKLIIHINPANASKVIY